MEKLVGFLKIKLPFPLLVGTAFFKPACLPV